MRAMASRITNPTIVYSSVYSGADKRKHQSSASLAFVMGIHLWPVNSPHKRPITQKMFPFDDVIMKAKSATILVGSDVIREMPPRSPLLISVMINGSYIALCEGQRRLSSYGLIGVISTRKLTIPMTRIASRTIRFLNTMAIPWQIGCISSNIRLRISCTASTWKCTFLLFAWKYKRKCIHVLSYPNNDIVDLFSIHMWQKNS